MLSKSTTIPKILKNYLNYLTAIRGYSVNTVKAYCSDIMQFFNFIQDYKQIPVSINNFNIFILLQIKEADIIAFLVFLNFNKTNNPYTRQRKINAIRTFFKWLFSNYPIANQKKNPAIGIGSVKKMVRLPKHLTLEQAKQIQNIFNLKNSQFPTRNNAIIALFLSTGMRLSELINLNIIDINLTNNSTVVLGKNNKERKVYINKYCREKLLKYINERYRKEKIIDINSPLFINKSGERIGSDAVEGICTRAYKLIGIEGEGYTPHTLRHTAATIMYTHVKEDILLVKEFLGHSSLMSTEIYTHINNTKLKEATERNPLNYYVREESKCS